MALLARYGDILQKEEENANSKKENKKEDISEIDFADGRILLSSEEVGI